MFRELHHSGRILILPNAWDVPSARMFEQTGFPAVATSSAAMMVSLGYPDGEVIPRDVYLRTVRKIAGLLSVPLTVDAAAGFGRTPAEVARTAKAIIGAGGIGMNIEDFDHQTKKLFDLGLQLRKIKAVKKVGEELKVPVVINARTDALRFAPGDEASKLGEAISRSTAFRDAGADCLYPMGLVSHDSIREFVRSVRFPVNVMVRDGLPPVKTLQRLGVARVSFGPYASYAAMGLLKRISREVLEKGTYSSLLDGAVTFDELNSLAMPKGSS